MTEVIVAIVALVVGAVVGWFLRDASARAILVATREQLQERMGELNGLKSDLASSTESLRLEGVRRAAADQTAARVPDLEERLRQSEALAGERGAKIAELETTLADERKATSEKLSLLNDAKGALSNEFKALSADALRENNQAFLELAKTNLGTYQQHADGELQARQTAVEELVRPLRESLAQVDGKLGALEQARLAAYSALDEQLRGLVETHLPQLRNETANLVKALRQPTVRGRWGEIQLKRVVEMAGMLDHCDFIEQETRTTEDGRLRPDMIVRLPGGKRIVVDAKAPLSAYLNAIEASDESAQRAFLADHAAQVRSHMVNLGRKGYWDQFDPTPEFVVLFLPGEMFFSAALQQDPGLIEFGVNERVIPATPTTLISLLKATAYGWRQEAIAKNAKEIADLGRLLYARVAKLGEHWANVGDKLNKAVVAFNDATATLESRVFVTARRLRDLKTAPEGVEIETPIPVEKVARLSQAPEHALGPLDQQRTDDFLLNEDAPPDGRSEPTE